MRRCAYDLGIVSLTPRLILGLLACLWGAIILKGAAGDPALERFEFTQPEMGVPFRIVLYAPNATSAKAAADAAFKRIAQLNEIMSDYETDSELNELSRTSGRDRAVHVSDDLWTVLQRAQEVAKLSDGAFDITVGPAVSLWRRARRSQHMPEPERLAEALKGVGYRKVQLEARNHTVKLLVPGMKLDLGGIAKGYALDQAVKVLQTEGIDQALVTGGGDMAMSGAPPGQTGWRIEVAPLDVPNAPPTRFVRLAHAALATSGDVFQRLEIDGRRYSHIVNPHTGVGLTDHSLVTAIASDGITADALSTAVSVLGPEKGMKLIEQIPGTEALIVRRPDEKIEMLESSGFSKYYEK